MPSSLCSSLPSTKALNFPAEPPNSKAGRRVPKLPPSAETSPPGAMTPLLVWMSTMPAVRKPYCAGSEPVMSCRLPTKRGSSSRPNPEMPSGRRTSLMRYWRFGVLRPGRAGRRSPPNRRRLPGAWSSTWLKGASAPCGWFSICCWSIRNEVAPRSGRMSERAWSSWPVTTTGSSLMAPVAAGGGAGGAVWAAAGRAQARKNNAGKCEDMIRLRAKVGEENGRTQARRPRKAGRAGRAGRLSSLPRGVDPTPMEPLPEPQSSPVPAAARGPAGS